MDVGANHGLFGLFAAALGAQVVQLEPQASLCEIISYAAGLNGKAVADRIALYNYAALDAREFINMDAQDIAEGAIATVVRSKPEQGKDPGVKTGAVEARPISDFAPAGDRRIAFLKIDVEGFELHGIISAYGLFGSKADAAAGQLFGFARVENAVVEFGPPNRWGVASNTKEDGAAVLATMENTYGFEPRLVDSLVWNDYNRLYGEGKLEKSTTDFGDKQHVLKDYVALRGAGLQMDLVRACGLRAGCWLLRAGCCALVAARCVLLAACCLLLASLLAASFPTPNFR